MKENPARVFLTGVPGVGKSTVIRRLVDELENRGFSVGGMLTSEIRTPEGVRKGFEILDLQTRRRGILASVDSVGGPRVGKYRVNLMDLDGVGALAITTAVKTADIVVVDEIGPMELHSTVFKQALREALASRRVVVGTIHRSARDPVLEELRRNPKVTILEVTTENRSNLHARVLAELQSRQPRSENG
ncbi:MAG: NTPase [Candidatus Bathyarchaeia archaeon]